jgi:hypothetical protein
MAGPNADLCEIYASWIVKIKVPGLNICIASASNMYFVDEKSMGSAERVLIKQCQNQTR